MAAARPDQPAWIRDMGVNAKGEIKEVGRDRLNPQHYPVLFPKIRPAMMEHKQGFLSCSSTAEANDIVSAFNAYQDAHPGGRRLRIAAFHSKLGKNDAESARLQKQVKEAFERGEIDYLVTVHMLDEGLNFGRMSLYIDLNKAPPIKTVMQRIGRLMRFAPKDDHGYKEHVDIMMMADLNAESAKDMLELADMVKKQRFRPDPNGDDPKPDEIEKLPYAVEDIAWDLDKLVARLRAQGKEFFTKEQKQFEAGSADAERVLDYAARAGRLPRGERNSSERVLHNLLSQYLDMPVADRNAKVFTMN
jgi:superfamily II DNA/RNA helicase